MGSVLFYKDMMQGVICIILGYVMMEKLSLKENQYEKFRKIEIQYLGISMGNGKNDTLSYNISYVSCHNQCFFAHGADTGDCGVREPCGKDITYFIAWDRDF